MSSDDMGGTAIVVGMSGSTGLAVVRALASAGVACHGVHFDGGTPAMATRLARGHRSPDWRADPKALVDFLVDLAGRLGLAGGEGAGSADGELRTQAVASLFVCHDAALEPVWEAVARLRAAGLRPAFAFVRSPAGLLDKRAQIEAATRAGVAAPWTRWGTAADLEAAAGECPFPAILKPVFSHLGVRALGAKALRCADADELRAVLATAPDVELMLQEYVPGGDDQLYTAGLFVGSGRHVAFTGRKLKQHPPGLGIARLAEAVDEPGLVPGGIALLAELGYEGIAQVEYKRDARDGSFRLMEANFRPWTWLGLATACGVNLPLAAHRWALEDDGPGGAEEKGRPVTDAAVSAGAAASIGPRRWIWLVAEAAHTARDLRHGVWPQLSQWRGLRAEAFFSRTDPLPLRRAVEGALGPRVRRLQGTARAVRRVARLVLMAPAAVLNGAVLLDEWRRAGRRSVTGGSPAIGLPQSGVTLVLAPHPDDETLMAGATLAGLRRRGDAVRVVAVTAGDATAVGRGATATRDRTAPASQGIGDLRTAELHAACRALGIDDVDVWDFSDGALSAQLRRLSVKIRDELLRLRPDVVVVPFPYDAHLDHVVVGLALADAISALGEATIDGAGEAWGREPGADAVSPVVLCGSVRMPFSAGWPTRLVPAGGTWAARRAAVSAYSSRGRAIFAAPSLFARLHPARPARATESFIELAAAGYVAAVREMQDRGLTVPDMTGGGHPLWLAPRLLRTRTQREEVAAVLRRVAASP